MTTATPCKEFPGDQSFGLGEVPPTLTGGGDTSGRVCGRVETGCLSAVHVLATGENEMATLGIFVEPQLPMTHLKSWRSVGGGRRLGKMNVNTWVSNSFD